MLLVGETERERVGNKGWAILAAEYEPKKFGRGSGAGKGGGGKFIL